MKFGLDILVRDCEERFNENTASSSIIVDVGRAWHENQVVIHDGMCGDYNVPKWSWQLQNRENRHGHCWFEMGIPNWPRNDCTAPVSGRNNDRPSWCTGLLRGLTRSVSLFEAEGCEMESEGDCGCQDP